MHNNVLDDPSRSIEETGREESSVKAIKMEPAAVSSDLDNYLTCRLYWDIMRVSWSHILTKEGDTVFGITALDHSDMRERESCGHPKCTTPTRTDLPVSSGGTHWIEQSDGDQPDPRVVRCPAGM